MKEFQLSFEDQNISLESKIRNIRENRIPLNLILDGLTDIANIGMIFRTADAVRLNKIYLYKVNKNINLKSLKKKSRSAVEYIDYEFISDIEPLIELKKTYKFVVLEKTNLSINYYEYEYKAPVCIIIGSEKTGVSNEIINLADISLHLEMNGVNSSINVATAASVILYDFLNKYCC